MAYEIFPLPRDFFLQSSLYAGVVKLCKNILDRLMRCFIVVYV